MRGRRAETQNEGLYCLKTRMTEEMDEMSELCGGYGFGVVAARGVLLL